MRLKKVHKRRERRIEYKYLPSCRSYLASNLRHQYLGEGPTKRAAKADFYSCLEEVKDMVAHWGDEWKESRYCVELDVPDIVYGDRRADMIGIPAMLAGIKDGQNNPSVKLGLHGVDKESDELIEHCLTWLEEHVPHVPKYVLRFLDEELIREYSKRLQDYWTEEERKAWEGDPSYRGQLLGYPVFEVKGLVPGAEPLEQIVFGTLEDMMNKVKNTDLEKALEEKMGAMVVGTDEEGYTVHYKGTDGQSKSTRLDAEDYSDALFEAASLLAIE